jgi:hypothetical protein
VAIGDRTGQIGSDPISGMVARLTEMHVAAIDDVTRLIADYVARSTLKPDELGRQARPILETIGDEFIAYLDRLGHSTGSGFSTT